MVAMPGCSKAPRGLFVLVQVGRVFTAIAISLGKGSRQLSPRDAFRAGRNLHDKELRYRRTVIVTAAVYRSFSSVLHSPPKADNGHLPLTYRHWAGVSPYTFPFGFAGTCVFAKQSRDSHLLHPTLSKYQYPYRNTDTQKGWGGHLANLRPACLPSSLSLFLPLALAYSANPPVSVCGTVRSVSHHESFLGV